MKLAYSERRVSFVHRGNKIKDTTLELKRRIEMQRTIRGGCHQIIKRKLFQVGGYSSEKKRRFYFQNSNTFLLQYVWGDKKEDKCDDNKRETEKEVESVMK